MKVNKQIENIGKDFGTIAEDNSADLESSKSDEKNINLKK